MKNKFMENQFYIIGTKFIMNSYNLSCNELQKDLKWVDLIKGDFANFSFPLVFHHISGTKKYDIIAAGFPSLFLISNRFSEIMKINNITGYKTYPVVIVEKNGIQTNEYVGLSIAGKSDNRSFTNSIILSKRLTETAPISKSYLGFEIDENKWDKSDFFLVGDTTNVLITEKLKKVIKQNAFSNIVVEPIDKYEISFLSLGIKEDWNIN